MSTSLWMFILAGVDLTAANYPHLVFWASQIPCYGIALFHSLIIARNRLPSTKKIGEKI